MNLMVEPAPIEDPIVAPITLDFLREEWQKVDSQMPPGLSWRLMKAEQAASGLEAIIDLITWDQQARNDVENSGVLYKSPLNQRVMMGLLDGAKNLAFTVVESYDIIRSAYTEKVP